MNAFFLVLNSKPDLWRLATESQTNKLFLDVPPSINFKK